MELTKEERQEIRRGATLLLPRKTKQTFYRLFDTCDSLEQRAKAAERERDELRKVFGHYHVNQGNGSDKCGRCGMDLRDPIHTRS